MAERPLQILAIPGSLRRQSYNKSLLQAAAQAAPHGIDILVYAHLAEVPLFNEDVADVEIPAGVRRLHEALRHSDAVLISTPEYNQAVPGVVKNMIDWLSLADPPEGLEGRPVGVTGVTTGRWGTRLAQTMLRQMLVSVQALVLPQPFLYLRDGAALFDDRGSLIDVKVRDRLSDLVSALGDWAVANRVATGATPALQAV